MVVGECCGELIDVVAKLSLAGGAKAAAMWRVMACDGGLESSPRAG